MKKAKSSLKTPKMTKKIQNCPKPERTKKGQFGHRWPDRSSVVKAQMWAPKETEVGQNCQIAKSFCL